jgi:hypothetical protein
MVAEVGGNDYLECINDFEDYYTVNIDIFNILNDDAVHGNNNNADFDDSNIIE